MKRIVALVFTILLTVSLVAVGVLPSVQAAAGDNIGNINYGYATLDGEKDITYTKSSSEIAINKSMSGPVAEDGRATGKAYVLYDNNYLYIFVAVTDSTVSTATPPAAGNTEGVNIMLDYLITQDTPYKTNPSGAIDYEQARIRSSFQAGKGTITDYVQADWDYSQNGYLYSDRGAMAVEMVAVPTDAGYDMEFRIPLSSTVKTSVTNCTDLEIGIGFQIMDDQDNDGERESYSYNDPASEYEYTSGSQNLTRMTVKCSELANYKAYYAEGIVMDGLKDDGKYVGECIAVDAPTPDYGWTSSMQVPWTDVWVSYDGDYMYIYADIKDKSIVTGYTTDQIVDQVEGLDIYLDFLFMEEDDPYRDHPAGEYVTLTQTKVGNQGRIQINYVDGGPYTVAKTYFDTVEEARANRKTNGKDEKTLHMAHGGFDLYAVTRRTDKGYATEIRVELSSSLRDKLQNSENPYIGFGVQVNNYDSGNTYGIAYDGTQNGDTARTSYVNDRGVVEQEYLHGSRVLAPLTFVNTGLADPADSATPYDGAYIYPAGSTAPVTMDGTKDAIYSNATPVYVNEDMDGHKLFGTSKATAQVRTVYDAENIYFFAEVTDKTLLTAAGLTDQNGNAASVASDKEGITFFLDFLYPEDTAYSGGDKNGWTEHPYDQGVIACNFVSRGTGTTYHATHAEGSDGAYSVSGSATSGNYLRRRRGYFETEMVMVQTATGYNVELRVKLGSKVLSKLMNGQNPAISLGFQINDFDERLDIAYASENSSASCCWDNYLVNNEWKTDSSPGKGSSGFTPMNLNGLKTYAVTLNPNGGVNVGGSSLWAFYNTRLSRTALLSSMPAIRPGCDFVGWYSADTQSYWTNDMLYPLTADTTLTAQWDAYSYPVMYALNNGANASGNPSSYKVTDSTVTLSQPTRPGYTFTGWTENISTDKWYAGFVNLKTGELGATPADGWENAVYSEMVFLKAGVTYNINGTGLGEVRWRIYNADGSYNESASLGNVASYTPASDCYVRFMFQSCGVDTAKTMVLSTNQAPATVMTISAGSTGNRTYTANWQPKSYTLTFDAPGGTSTFASKPVTYDAAIGELPTASRIGCTFNGWQMNGTQITAATLYQVPDNSTATAIWTANNYSLIFNPNGGSAVNNMTVTYGEPVGNLAVPTREGYTFSGWQDASGTPYTAETLYQVAEDTILTANWTANQYTLTLVKNGGIMSDADTKTVTYDAEIGQLPTPTRPGYEFNGWKDNNGTLYTAGTVYKVAKDTTLTAQWTPRKEEGEVGDHRLPTIIALVSISVVALLAVVLLGRKRRK